MSAVLITGAGSGIGRATAIALSGKRPLLLLDNDADALDEVARSAPIAPEIARGSCRTAVADVSAPGAVAQALEAADELGPVSGAVHCAGTLSLGSLIDHDPAELSRVLEVNVSGTAATLKAVHPHLRANGGGSVVVIGSNAGRTPRIGMGRTPHRRPRCICSRGWPPWNGATRASA